MSALEEIVAALHLAEARLTEAGGQLGSCHTALEEASEAIARLDPENPDTTVPPGITRSIEQLERTQLMLETVREAIQAFVTYL